MLIIFSVNDQKITHDLKGQLVAGSVDIVQAAFKFDSSWAELDKIATGDKAKWDATSTKVEGIAEGATKVEASTTEGNIKINGMETAVVTIATDTEVTEMLTEVFGATA